MNDSAAKRELAWRLEEAGISRQEFVDAGHLDAANADLAHIYRQYYVTEDELLDTPRFVRHLPDTNPPTPRPYLSLDDDHAPQYTHLKNARTAVIGYGAAAVILGSYASIRGARDLTFVDPRREPGGIWTEPSTRFGGFNNPAHVQFSPDHILNIADRDGANMLNFIQGIAADHLGDARILRDTVSLVTRNKQRDTWLIHTEVGQTAEADYLVLATGTPQPRRIHGSRIRTNLDSIANHVPSVSLVVERAQRKLSSAELGSGRQLVIVGVGNSMAAMLNQIHLFEDAHHVAIPYVVLSDLTPKALANPTVPIDGRRVFRSPPDGNFTGYSGDLPRDNRSYKRALQQGKIIGNVKQIVFDTRLQQLTVRGTRVNMTIERPHVFALIGHTRDMTLYRQLGALTKGHFQPEANIPSIRPSDGAIYTKDAGYMSNAFAVGACAVTPRNPNAGVIPGIVSQVPRTILTLAVRQTRNS